MLLGSTNIREQYADEEALITLLLTQKRYAEAYALLQNQPPGEPSTQYNIALCHYWADNYQEALISLDNAQLAMSAIRGNASILNNQFYNAIRQQQNDMDDHYQAITKKYVALFDVLTRDAIIRFKTDCWLHLGNFPKVIEVATPIAHKNYKNITGALQIAKNQTTYEQ